MTKIFSKLAAKTALKIVAAAGLGLGASGCVYDAGIGLGYASDNYGGNNYANGYGCDPYSPFDSYYDCDYRYGFGNIGFGGGWFNDYYYPGNGFFLFDNFGRRFNMQRDHYRYWGQRRYEWNRGRPRHNDHRGDNRGGYPGRGGYGDNLGGHGNPAYRPQRGDRPDRYEGRGRHDGPRSNHGGGPAPIAPQANVGSGNPQVQPRFTRSGYIRGDSDGEQNRNGQGEDNQGRFRQDTNARQPQSAAPPAQVQSTPERERSESVPRPERSRSFGGAMRQPNVKED